MNREILKKDFIDAHISVRRVSEIPGDASARNYTRLFDGSHSYILMDAPPPQDVLPFIKVDEWLRDAGIYAPRILAQDVENGLLLIEDLGDEKYSNIVAGMDEQAWHAQISPYYREAIYMLSHLHTYCIEDATRMEGFAEYSEAKLLEEAVELVDWYIPHMTDIALHPEARQDFCDAWEETLKQIDGLCHVVALRDVHCDNLIWISSPDDAPEGAAALRHVGVLDFQDAVIGHPAYDLASLLEDARQDIPESFADEMLDYYAQLQGMTPPQKAELQTAFNILTTQRHMKIVGRFARLAYRDGKRGYLDMIPHVWSYIERHMDKPELAPVQRWMKVNMSPVEKFANQMR